MEAVGLREPSIRTLVVIVLCLLGGADTPKELPRLSFGFFDPKLGKPIEPDQGWIAVRRNESLHFRVLLEVESAEARYESLIFRDSDSPDPLLVGSKRPQNLWIEAFQLDSNGRRSSGTVPILTHHSGGGKSLRVYSSMIELRILYSEPERSRRCEALIDHVLGRDNRKPAADPDEIESQREAVRGQISRYGIDMPPGDYELEARYAPNVDGTWRGHLEGTVRIRVRDEGDPLAKP